MRMRARCRGWVEDRGGGGFAYVVHRGQNFVLKFIFSVDGGDELQDSQHNNYLWSKNAIFFIEI